MESAVWPLLILTVTVGVYLPTLWFEFTYDDQIIVVENEFIKFWRFVPDYFTRHVWTDVYGDVPSNYYRPIFLCWLRLNHAIFGYQPAGWHFTSLLAHALASMLMYFLIRRFTQQWKWSLLGALLFGLHPVHIESVAWVSAVPEPIAACFLIGAYLLFLRLYDHPASPRHGWLRAAALVLALLAALTKEVGVVLPCLILVHAWMVPPAKQADDSPLYAPPRARRALQAAAPFFGVAALYFAARILVLGGIGHAAVPLAAGTVLNTLPLLLLKYLRQLTWPFGLSPFYDAPYEAQFSFVRVMLPLLVLALLAILGVRLGTRRPGTGIAAAWVVVPLLPLLDLRIFPQGEILHDRYLYLSSAGFVLMVVTLLEARDSATRISARSWLTAGAAVLLAATYGVGTWMQLAPWRNDLTLYQHAVEGAPENDIATNNLALVFLKQGRIDQAKQLLERVVARNPRFYLASLNLGAMYYQRKEYAKAEEHIRRALDANPSSADALMLLGRIALRAGQPGDAERLMRRAIELRSRHPGYRIALAVVLRSTGRQQEALQVLLTELALFPDSAMAQRLLAQMQNSAAGAGDATLRQR